MPSASSRSRTRRRNDVNWLNTRARWPSAASSSRWSTSTSILADPTPAYVVVDQGGVEAELAQPGQRAEDRDPVAVEVVDQAEDRSAARAAGGSRRSRRCRGVSATSSTCSCLGGRSAATSSLVRRSRNGRIRRRKRRSTSASPSFSTGLATSSVNWLRPGVEARRDDREQRPQLEQAVLDRRAGDGEPERDVEAADRLVGLALVVLDRSAPRRAPGRPSRARRSRRPRAGSSV